MEVHSRITNTLSTVMTRLHISAFQKIVDTFGVRVRALDEVLAAQPAQVQDRWAAQLYFLSPALRVALVALFAASAAVGVLTPSTTIAQLVSGSLLAHAQPVLLARVSAGLDALLAIGLALSARPRPWLAAMGVLVAAYTAAFGVLLPHAWAEPMGGLLKNLVVLPAVAVAWVLGDRR